MAKFSYEFKKKVIDDYLNGGGGTAYLSKKYSVSQSNIRRWIDAYKNLGEDSLKRSRQNAVYSLEYKLEVVQLYLTSEISYKDLALQEKINNPTLIVSWVREYRKHGVDGLKPHRKGRQPKLGSPPMKKKETNNEVIETIDTSAEHVKQLEDENYHLRLELACLKESRRLRLEEEALNKKRESSTVSEDHSN